MLRERFGHARFEGLVPLLSLLTEDGDLGLVLRHGDVDDQPTRETSEQALVQSVDLGGWAVTSKDDLTPRFAHSVEKPEKDLLSFFLPGKELDVVKEKDVEFLVPFSELFLLPGLDGLRELVEEALDRHIHDAETGMYPGGIVGDRVEDVGLPQTR